MSIRLRRPSLRDLFDLAAAGTHDVLTYEPVGITSSYETPNGYRRDQWSIDLGQGAQVFDRASDAVRQWQVHKGAGLLVAASGPPTVGSVVAMAAPLPVGFIEVVCRVLAVVDDPDRYGFSYGTLRVHPEQGEESFSVVRHADGRVTFDIVAVSKPRQPLARICPPVARRLQHRATNRYLDAMRSAATR